MFKKYFFKFGHWFTGGIFKVDSEIQMDVTTNPEIDVTGGGFILRIKDGIIEAWRVISNGVNILEVDTLNQKIIPYWPIEGANIYKNKIDATVAPTATDDFSAGYSVDSTWVDVVANKAYVCVDSTATAAIWKETTGGAIGLANTNIINSKQDYIDIATSYVGGVITLPGGIYYQGANIDSVGDRIVAGGDIVFIGNEESETILEASTLVGDLITATDVGISIIGMCLRCPNGTLLNVSNPALTKELTITRSRLDRANTGIKVGGTKDIHIDTLVHFATLNAGIVLTADVRHLHLNSIFVSHSRNSGTGPQTFLGWSTFKATLFESKTVNFASAQAGDIAIDVSNVVDPTTFADASIHGCNFVGYNLIPLKGVNANTPNWHITSAANVGLAGLYKDSRTLVLGSYTSQITYPLFGNVPETVPVENIADFEDDATVLKGTVLADVAYSLNGVGTSIYLDIYNITDNAVVVGSELQVDFNGLAVYPDYHVVETPEVTLLPNKSYRVRQARHTGTGNPTAYLRAATLKIKAY